MKLNHRLVAGIDLDPVRRIRCGVAGGFCRQQAEIITEGVETGTSWRTPGVRVCVFPRTGLPVSAGRPLRMETFVGSLLTERQRPGAPVWRAGTGGASFP